MLFALAQLACESASNAQEQQLSVEINDTVTTVMTARWETDEPTRGKVRFGVVGESSVETPYEDAATTEHERLILGMPVDSEVELVGLGDDGSETGVITVETGNLPPEWPTWEVSYGDATWEGFLFTGFSYGFSGIIALDPHARPVWWWDTNEANTVPSRVFPGVDRDAVYVSLAGPGYERGADLAQISWQGDLVEQTDVPRLTHDFLQRPDGTFAGIVETDHFQGQNVCYGDGITEFAWGEEPILRWDGWDEYGDTEFDCATDPFGLLHLNALDWDDEAGQYLIDSRNLGTITVVDGESFGVVESLGNYGEYTPDVPDSAPLNPHQFERLSADRYLVVDDGGEDRLYSRVMEYEIDREGGQFSTAWQYRPDPDLFVVALGDVERLESGNTLLDWSTCARLEEVDPSGETVWQLDAEFGNAFTYMNRVDRLYEGG